MNETTRTWLDRTHSARSGMDSVDLAEIEALQHQDAGRGIGVQNEKSRHAALKQRYA